MSMLAAKMTCACDSFSCSMCSIYICTASKSMMLLGVEGCAVHALTFTSLTCSGAHDLYSPGVRQGHPAVRGTFSFCQVLRRQSSSNAAFGVGAVPVSGKQHCRQPSYGFVTVDSITQQASLCPHFALWKQVPPQDFLLNDMLNLWPDLRRIPHDAQQQGAAVQQQQGQQQRPLKRLCKRSVPYLFVACSFA